MVTVIIAAAGQGKRMKNNGNKVFMLLADKPILLHSIMTFSACPEVDNLLVVVAPDEVHDVENMLRGLTGIKTFQVVPGGSERQYSIANALKLVPEKTAVVLVHDGARPLVTTQCINNVIQGTLQYGATIAAVPVKDTIKTVDDGLVTGTLERSALWSIQTPQGFTTQVLRQAYEQANQDKYLGTDDASLVERVGVTVTIVAGNYENIKVTTPEDLIIAEALLQARN